MISAKTIKKTALAPTVLITHGGGFLAGHLAQTLLLKNCRVVVLSDLSRHKDPQLKGLLKSPKFALFDCDINTELPDAIDSVDYIFHLANYDAFLTVDDAPDLEGLLSAGVGTKHLLDLARRSQAKFALVCPVQSKVKSIGGVRGDGGGNNENLGAILASGLSIDEAQNYSKALVTQYRDRYNLDARFVYLGQVYGVGMNLEQGGELAGLLGDILESRPLKVYGDGERKEFYTFFTDAVSGLVKSLFSGGTGGLFTLVDQKPHTSLEIAYILKSLSTGKTDLEFAESDKVFEEPKLEEFSYPPAWLPKVELKDGLVKTLKAFGYKPNTRAFKVGALIDEKLQEKTAGSTIVSDTSNIPGIFNSANSSSSNNSAPSSQVEDLQTITPPVREEPKINPVKLAMYRLEKKFRQAKSALVGTAGMAGSDGSTIGSYGSDGSKGSAILSRIKLGVGIAIGITSVAGVLLGVPLVQSYSHAKSALNDLENYQISIAQLDSAKSQELSQNAYSHLSKLEKSLNRASPLIKIAGKSKMLTSLQAFTESAKNFSSSLYSLSLGAEPFSNLWEGLKPNGNPNYDLAEFKTASLHFADAKQKLGFAQASLNMVDKTSLPKTIRDDFEKYQTTLGKLTENSDFITQLALEFPSIIGLDGQRRYLVLFQNNNEIRPTGGFLGSYAAVEVKDGKIANIMIDDIYNPDGQLKLSKANEVVKSPTPVAQALEEENLYIRNANWDPSFPQSVQTITNLFKLVEAKTYDGVFAVDLYFARDLLAVMGPVYLTAFDEEIRVDNMYERAQFHSDFDFKEGVSTKKAFLTILGGKMLEKLFALPQEQIPVLANALYASLEQKHLLIDLSGSYLANYLAEKGWNGGLLESDGDYLYVVNANLGGTKSNYYVKNDMNYAVSAKTSDGVLRGELELTYENTQKNADWPGGPYKNYVRVLVADGSKLTGAYLMGGQEEAKLAQVDEPVLGASNGTNIFDKVVISKIGKYTSFEYQITVNPQEKVKLLFNYDLPPTLSAKKDTNKYSLVWQKQPGTQNDGLRFMFASPFGTKILEPMPIVTFAENIYEYKSVLNSDLRVRLGYK